jgi:hypothetical protein
MDLEGVKKLLSEHDEQVDSVLGKIGEMAKERFAGHDEQIDKAVHAAQEYDFSGGKQAAGQPAEQAGEQQPPAQG